MRDMTGQMMGSMWIWTIVGVLLIVLLVVAIVEGAPKTGGCDQRFLRRR